MSFLGGNESFDDDPEDISPEDVARAEAKAKRNQTEEEDYVFDELMRAIPKSNNVYWDSRLVDSIAAERRVFQAIPTILAIVAVCVTACGLVYREFHAAGASFVFLPISLWFRNFLKEYPKTYSVYRFEKTYKKDNIIRLNCERLSDKAFQFLGQCSPGIKLQLDKLVTLSPLAAKYLANFHGHLSIRGLIFLLPEVEAELRKRSDWEKPVGCVLLKSDSLKTSDLLLLIYESDLSADDVRKILYAIDSGSDLHLSLARITVELASLLAAKCRGKLTLNHLTTITPEAAEALAKHEGDLSLNGLTMLTSEVAEALAKHKNCFFDDDFLYSRQGPLSLNGLTTITPEALKILRANPNIKLPQRFR